MYYDEENIVVSRVRSLSFSLTFAPLQDKEIAMESEGKECQSIMISMINKAGHKVHPNLDSIEKAMRVAVSLENEDTPGSCPGLGWCADLIDTAMSGAWPITALS